MPAVGRGPCLTTGHGPYPPTVVNGSGATVIVNGMPILKVGDPMTVHCSVVPKHPCHASAQSEGSGTVMAEGTPVGRVGDSIGCGDACAQGSTNVMAGG